MSLTSGYITETFIYNPAQAHCEMAKITPNPRDIIQYETLEESVDFGFNEDVAFAQRHSTQAGKALGPNELAMNADFFDTVYKVVAMYENTPNADIKEALGINEKAIYYVRDYVQSDEFAQFNGDKIYLKKNRQKKTAAERLRMLQDYQADLDSTVEEIAGKYDVSTNYIYRKKKEANQIIKEYATKGSLISDIAKKYNVDSGYVADLCEHVASKEGRIADRPRRKSASRAPLQKTDLENLRILYDCDKGESTLPGIAKKHGVSTKYIRGLRTNAEEIIACYEQNTKPAEIRDRFGVNAGYVLDLVHLKGKKRAVPQGKAQLEKIIMTP